MLSHSFTQHLSPFVTSIDRLLPIANSNTSILPEAPRKKQNPCCQKATILSSGNAHVMKRRTRWPSRQSRQKDMDDGKFFRWRIQFVAKRQHCSRSNNCEDYHRIPMYKYYINIKKILKTSCS